MKPIPAAIAFVLLTATAILPCTALEVVETVDLTLVDPQASPEWIALDTQNNKILVSHSNLNEVWKLAEVSHQHEATYSAPAPITAIAVFPLLGKVYVSVNAGVPYIAVLSVYDLSVMGTIPLSSPPSGMAASPATARLYVASEMDPQLTVIDAGDDYVNTGLGGFPPLTGIAVNETTNKIYVASSSLDAIGEVDGSTLNSGFYYGGGDYARLAVNAVTNKVWATLPDYYSIRQMDPLSALYGEDHSVGAEPFDIAVSSATNTAYVTLRDNYEMLETSGDGSSADTFHTVGADPRGIAINEANGRVYVCNNGAGSLSVFDEGGSAADVSPPYIEGWGISELVVDKGGDWTNVSITVKDESQVTYVEVAGTPLAYQGSNRWSADIPTDPFADYGDVNYSILARDEYNNEATSSGYYRIAPPLNLRIRDWRYAPIKSRQYVNVFRVCGVVTESNPGWTFKISDGSTGTALNVWSRGHNLSVGQFVIVRGQAYSLETASPGMNCNFQSIVVVNP